MAFDDFMEAVSKYVASKQKLGVKHAGFLSYSDDRGRVIARKPEKGFDKPLRPLSRKEIEKAARDKKRRAMRASKLSGVIGHGRSRRRR